MSQKRRARGGKENQTKEEEEGGMPRGAERLQEEGGETLEQGQEQGRERSGHGSGREERRSGEAKMWKMRV